MRRSGASRPRRRSINSWNSTGLPENGEMRETGDALEVREVHTKQRGLCGELRNVPASALKDYLMSEAVFPTCCDKYTVPRTAAFSFVLCHIFTFADHLLLLYLISEKPLELRHLVDGWNL